MMILHVDSSINGEKSVSRLISRSVVDQLMARNPDAEIVRRDLAAEPLPHLCASLCTANQAITGSRQASSAVRHSHGG